MTLKAWRVPGLQGRPVAQTPRKEWLLQSESKGGLQAEGPSSGTAVFSLLRPQPRR